MKRNQSKKGINIFFVVLFIILALAIISQFTLFKPEKINLPQESAQRQGNESVQDAFQGQQATPKLNVIKIDFGKNRQISRSISARTPYEALQQVANQEKFDLVTKQYKYGLMVEQIDKVKNEANMYWMYSVNGKPGRIAADRHILNPGDSLEWKYVGP